ncbi:MAG: S24 family peptidase [bacterium]
MKLNLSDDPVTAELLAESLRHTSTAVISVNGTSMHPTLQMGWRMYVAPVRGEELKVGEIAVFRGERYLTIHRLVWKERSPGGDRLVFRGDYNRLRERVDPGAVIARVVAVEIPGRRRGTGKVVSIEPDVLARFYRLAYGVWRLFRPVLPEVGSTGSPPGRVGRAARSVFAGLERFLSIFLPEHR